MKYSLWPFDGYNEKSEYFYSTDNIDVPLKTQPHYTEKDFNKPKIVFGRNINGLSWDCDDRLQEWNWDKSEEARNYAKESGAVLRSARFYQTYLSKYFDKNIKLFCIMAGVNLPSGYPYCIFGYKEEK